MSRSKKKHAIAGITTASEKQNKKQWHEKFRRKNRILSKQNIAAETEYPKVREVSDVWKKECKRMSSNKRAAPDKGTVHVWVGTFADAAALADYGDSGYADYDEAYHNGDEDELWMCDGDDSQGLFYDYGLGWYVKDEHIEQAIAEYTAALNTFPPGLHYMYTPMEVTERYHRARAEALRAHGLITLSESGKARAEELYEKGGASHKLDRLDYWWEAALLGHRPSMEKLLAEFCISVWTEPETEVLRKLLDKQ
jgi:hypothetical protein